MWLPKNEDIENYLLLAELLAAQKKEFDALSKKKSDGQLNLMKIKMVNRVLEPLNALFKNEPSHSYLDILNEDDLPTNSDVVLIISQYKTAIKNFREKYYVQDEGELDFFDDESGHWHTEEAPED